MTASVFLFNPFAEGVIARGRVFTPAKHQVMLAADLANLTQFLCQPHDIVLLAKRPSAGFLQSLEQAGFQPPEFVELRDGHLNPADDVFQRELGSLRPWAWAPDSVELLAPLFARMAGETRSANQYFNDDIARLYSKAWSAGFLKKVLANCRRAYGISASTAETQCSAGNAAAAPWLCSPQEAGTAADTLEDALEAIAVIRRRGHHRVVVKQGYGAAGQNSIRLWEPEIQPAQRQWLAHALEDGQQLVVEPWLERELDFSIQLEMESRGLKLCGYTGLVNDRKGQFLANWAEPAYAQCLPAKVTALFQAPANISERLQHQYDEIFSLLETELQRVGFAGPVSIDAMVYRTPQGDCRLKPVVEINPRYTMGRVTLELMKHACPGSCGLFRLITQAQARQEGFADFRTYARAYVERLPVQLDREGKIRQGVLCLNDPDQAQVCVATFQVGTTLNLPGGK